MRTFVVAALAVAVVSSPACAGVIVDQFSFAGNAVIFNPLTGVETTAASPSTVSGELAFDSFGSNIQATSVVITSITNPPQTFFSPVGLQLVNSPYAEQGGINNFDVVGNGMINEDDFYQVYYPEGTIGQYPLGMGFQLGGLLINLPNQEIETSILGPVTFTTISDTFPQPVPEPWSIGTLSAGVIGLLLMRRMAGKSCRQELLF